MAKRLLVLSCRVPSAAAVIGVCSLVACKADTMWVKPLHLWEALARELPAQTAWLRCALATYAKPYAAPRPAQKWSCRNQTHATLAFFLHAFCCLLFFRSIAHQHFFFSLTERKFTHCASGFFRLALGCCLDGHNNTPPPSPDNQALIFYSSLVSVTRTEKLYKFFFLFHALEGSQLKNDSITISFNFCAK